MISAALLSGVLEILPDRVVTVAFLFGGGLVAGLLTPGTVRDGALWDRALFAPVPLDRIPW